MFMEYQEMVQNLHQELEEKEQFCEGEMNRVQDEIQELIVSL